VVSARPVDADAARGERQHDTAGADSQFLHRASCVHPLHIMSTIDSKSYVTLTDANADGNQPVPHLWQETNTALTTQLEQVEVHPRVTQAQSCLGDSPECCSIGGRMRTMGNSLAGRFAGTEPLCGNTMLGPGIGDR
jgi:hypothetical protein